MPEINFNCYSLPNIEDSDRHSQDISYLIHIVYIKLT